MVIPDCALRDPKNDQDPGETGGGSTEGGRGCGATMMRAGGGAKVRSITTASVGGRKIM